MTADRTREEIMQAAGERFAANGFERTTVREICRDAHANLAAIKYHFGDKRGLYLEVVRLAHRLRAAQVPYPDWDARTTPEQKLRDVISTMVGRMVGLDQAPWPTRLLMREVLAPTAACQSLIEEYFRPQLETLLGILERLTPPSLPRSKQHKLAFSVIGQCLFYRVASPVVAMMISADELREEFSIDALSEHIFFTSLGMIQATNHPLGPLVSSTHRSYFCIETEPAAETIAGRS